MIPNHDDDDWMYPTDEEMEALEDSEPGTLWGIPLDGECFVNGVPLVTADYFDYDAQAKDAIAKALLGIEGAMLPDASPEVRQVLFFDPEWEGEEYTPAGIVGVATFGRARMRVETKRAAHTDSVRAAIERATGDLVRHRVRKREDSFQVDLGAALD